MSIEPSESIVIVEPSPQQPASFDLQAEVEKAIRAVQDNLRAKRGLSILWFDPVRTKNLEKTISHLHNILLHLPATTDRVRLASLRLKLDQLTGRGTAQGLSSQQVWELADLLEIELLTLADDDYLFQQLIALRRMPNNEALTLYFPQGYNAIDEDYHKNHKFIDSHRSRVRGALVAHQQALVNEYRRDRAKIGLRNRQLNFLVVCLGIILLVFGGLYIQTLSQFEALPGWHLALSFSLPTPDQSGQALLTFLPETPLDYFNQLVGLVAFAGALGGILSRTIRLSRQPLRGENESKLPPLGIRDLMSNWGLIWVQPFIGAASAVILFLVFQSGFLETGQTEWGPSQYSLVAFLAGFSEPFFLNIVGRLENQWSSST